MGAVSLVRGVVATDSSSLPLSVAMTGVPVAVAPNGTIAADGIVTLGTALVTTYSSGVWLRFPADAVVGGAAGVYWAVMTSTTQGQVYTNFFNPVTTPFVPHIPQGTLTPAVGSAVAYTQTNGAEITIINITIAGGLIGENGTLRVHAMGNNSSSANTKSYVARLATVAFASFGATTSTKHQYIDFLRNRGVQNRQIAYNNSSPFGATTGNELYLTVDTSVSTTMTIGANMPAGDAGVSFFVTETLDVDIV